MQSGLFMPGCVMLQPALYIRELAHGHVHKQTHPVSLYEQSPANRLKNKLIAGL